MAVENFNKNNPQLNSLKQILEQVKAKAAQLSQETQILKEDWERKKQRIESDQISEVSLINQKMIQKLSNDVDKLIKDKENETAKLKIKQQALEQQRAKQEQILDADNIELLKQEYVLKHSNYKQAYLEKAHIYSQIADQTREILEANTEFLEKECNHARKQLEKEICKVTAENNED